MFADLVNGKGLPADPGERIRQHQFLQSLIYRFDNMDYQYAEGFLPNDPLAELFADMQEGGAEPLVQALRDHSLESFFFLRPSFRERLGSFIAARDPSPSDDRSSELS